MCYPYRYIFRNKLLWHKKFSIKICQFSLIHTPKIIPFEELRAVF